LFSGYNIDSIAIAKILTKDKTAREQLVQLAISKKDQYAGIVDSFRTNTITVTKNRIDTSVKIVRVTGSGLSDSMIHKMDSTLNKDAQDAQKILGFEHIEFCEASCSNKLGWLITALAISLGAPFWFDLLNKFVQLRQVGTRPADPQSDNKNADKTPPPDTVG